jgi:hypothetical protein
MRRAAAASLFALLSLAGCQTGGGGGGGGVEISDAAYDLSTRLSETIGKCWFAPGETMLAGYIYSPERNAGVSRILIVKKDAPTGLPALVVEARSGNRADVYGPLVTSASGARIRGDIERWAKGGDSCA